MTIYEAIEKGIKGFLENGAHEVKVSIAEYDPYVFLCPDPVGAVPVWDTVRIDIWVTVKEKRWQWGYLFKKELLFADPELPLKLFKEAFEKLRNKEEPIVMSRNYEEPLKHHPDRARKEER